MKVEFTGRHDEAVITYVKRRWFRPDKNVSWRGSCTVWHNAETGKRAPTYTEGWLCDIWTKARWDRKQKENHK